MLAPCLSHKNFSFHCTSELYARLDAYRKAHSSAKGQPMARSAVLERALEPETLRYLLSG